MNILEIYKKYQIMPQLAEHQLRVAGVADVICENFSGDIDRENVVMACLLHDMGNIIKFDLSVTDKLNPGKFKKEDLEYWQKVKDNYVAKYGDDEHRATIKIAEELGVSERVVELIDCVGFQNAQTNSENEDLEGKVCTYSDMRVGPKGVISLEERFLDLRERYEHKHILMGGNESLRIKFEEETREIEKQIFAHCNIRPQDITQSAIMDIVERLKDFEI